MARICGEGKRIHFIGIGGIGMSGIAHLLLRQGAKVSGSDVKSSQITEELSRLGAEIFLGHCPENIQGADLIVYSSAIGADNPEIQETQRQGIPLVKRAEALAELMQGETVIVVTGSHGKTTTTSLVSYLLLEAGLSPTVAIGGIFKNIDSNACLGEGKFFVAEADESDGSFLYYQPNYSIITNIDREHLDYYKDLENEINTFKEFLHKTKDNGCVFCCADDLNLKQILKDYKKRYVLFGLRDSADIYPRNIKLKGLTSEFDCYYKDKTTPGVDTKAKFLDRFYLALGGEHNISNALSVIALGLELGIELKVIKDTLARYLGVRRRLETKFQDQRFLVLDDYAHHPSEIKVTLAAVRNLEFQRLIVIFQPHRYTRTKILLDEFAKSFDLADELVITDIYPASEPPIEGVTGECLADKIKEYHPKKSVYFLPKANIVSHILRNIRPGDLVITLGAGDIVKTGDELVEELKKQG